MTRFSLQQFFANCLINYRSKMPIVPLFLISRTSYILRQVYVLLFCNEMQHLTWKFCISLMKSGIFHKNCHEFVHYEGRIDKKTEFKFFPLKFCGILFRNIFFVSVFTPYPFWNNFKEIGKHSMNYFKWYQYSFQK